jgi:hypothetical protein
MKTLEIEMIPVGYNYAAIDSNGHAYAFITKPRLRAGAWQSSSAAYHLGKPTAYHLGHPFDHNGWQNSLIERTPFMGDHLIFDEHLQHLSRETDFLDIIQPGNEYVILNPAAEGGVNYAKTLLLKELAKLNEKIEEIERAREAIILELQR